MGIFGNNTRERLNLNLLGEELKVLRVFIQEKFQKTDPWADISQLNQHCLLYINKTRTSKSIFVGDNL